MDKRTKNGDSDSNSKVVRLIEEYNLSGLGEELASHWTADEDRMSLRQLSTYFNKKLLEAALAEHDVALLPGEVDNIYELLIDDDVTSGVRIQTENRLREYNINVNQVQSDFVSRQAIHTYLTEDRGVEYDAGDNDDTVIDRRLKETQRLRSRLEAVTERALSSLCNTERITLGEFQVLVSIRVQCSDCGKHFDVVDLFDQGGCECSSN